VTTEQPCPFCEIVAGRAPATFVHEWSDVIAIVPLNPVVDGHTLVIPKRHVPDFASDPAVSADAMLHAAQLMRWTDRPMNLITSRGREAGQGTEHLSIELIPREELDGVPIPWTPEIGDCPVCFAPRVHRNARDLRTCGDPQCGYTLRGRGNQGRPYMGGRPPASEEIGYNAAHARARKQLRGQPCAEADATCSGRPEVALRPGLPEESLRVAPDTGAKYFSGLDSSIGYRVLCRSHHAREGGLMAALSRYSYLATSFAIEQMRSLHSDECAGECTACAALKQYDEAAAGVLHLVPRAENDGLALPWYSGRSKGQR
jgi:histidine triad (HIT) family protein